MKTFPLWKTVTLGTYKNQTALNNVLIKKGFLMDNWVPKVIVEPVFTIASEKKKIDLVNVSVVDLGFTKSTPLGDIYEQASKLNLSPCPVEVGPQLRLQHYFQPKNDSVLVATEPILAPGGYPCIFCVARGAEDKCLLLFCGHFCNPWRPRDRFLFVHKHNSVA